MLRARPSVRPPRSDLTEGSGRMFSAAAIWNRPLGPELHPSPLTRVLHGSCARVEARTGPRIRHIFETGRDAFVAERDEDGNVLRSHQARLPLDQVRNDGADLMLVDHAARTILSARDWRFESDRGWQVEDLDVADLDGDAWGSPAVGLVLEHELAAGTINHAVGLWAPTTQLYGAWVRLTGMPTRLDPIGMTIARALVTYGGVVVGHNGHLDAPGPGLVVRIEVSRAAGPGDQIGPTYRQLGMGADPWPLALPIEDFEVLV